MRFEDLCDPETSPPLRPGEEGYFEPAWCVVCEAIVHEDEGVGCEECSGAAHRECAIEQWDGTHLCGPCSRARSIRAHADTDAIEAAAVLLRLRREVLFGVDSNLDGSPILLEAAYHVMESGGWERR